MTKHKKSPIFNNLYIPVKIIKISNKSNAQNNFNRLDKTKKKWIMKTKMNMKNAAFQNLSQKIQQIKTKKTVNECFIFIFRKTETSL